LTTDANPASETANLDGIVDKLRKRRRIRIGGQGSVFGTDEVDAVCSERNRKQEEEVGEAHC